MKPIIMTALTLLAVVFLLPLFLFGASGMTPSVPTDTPLPTLSASAAPVAVENPDKSRAITLLHTETGEIQTLSMDQYLWGVVAAEMPASFQPEALKAQCVAARTYAIRKGGSATPPHPEAMVCDDITCCQAYITPQQAAAIWDAGTPFYQQKISNAVADTDALVLTYEGALIDAVFHSSSEGFTADAAEVWGTAVPYLVSVDTPEGEEVPNFRTTVTLPLDEFTSAIQLLYPDASFGSDYTAWFGQTSYTAAGAVAVLPAGGAPVTGLQYRSLFSLRSARFALSVNEEGVTFHVTGYGHGAGMSQYGANALAKQGQSFRDILTHYYTGCRIEPLK